MLALVTMVPGGDGKAVQVVPHVATCLHLHTLSVSGPTDARISVKDGVHVKITI